MQIAYYYHKICYLKDSYYYNYYYFFLWFLFLPMFSVPFFSAFILRYSHVFSLSVCPAHSFRFSSPYLPFISIPPTSFPFFFIHFLSLQIFCKLTYQILQIKTFSCKLSILMTFPSPNINVTNPFSKQV